MKQSRAWLVWAALGLCAAMVISAMAVLTRNVMASQYERALADARATLEEQTRLALWRMDAAGAAILLRENQRPPADYNTPDSVVSPEVKMHFEVRNGGLASSGTRDGELQALRNLLSKNGDIAALLNRAASNSETAWQAVPKDAGELKKRAAQLNETSPQSNRYNQAYQDDSNKIEMAQRAKVVESQQISAAAFNQGKLGAAPQNISIKEITSMRPVWIENELFLLRQLMLLNPDGSTTSNMIQGAWLDAQAVRKLLLTEIADLLPGVRLETPSDQADDPLALVSLPFRLHRAEIAAPPMRPWSGPLLAGWAAVLCALTAVALLVRGVMRLSDRRASFVSAVTHELRTPLTTFRLYSDMLESGAVKPEKRGDYLRVLSREADRLSHLVENVLAFSRIERGNARSNVRDVTVAELLEPSREQLEARLATAGLNLEMDSSFVARVRVDIAAVEHILFNLIDNAAKYAANGEPPVVRIGTRDAGRFVEIIVSDHGPGIPVSEHGRIFRAFHKSAREAAESKPGVGLGLALSRRLAREQGGDLVCSENGNGACFILRLPAV
jgi:signal transduction histidine kinase